MVGIDSAYSVISNSMEETTSMTKYERVLYDSATFSNFGKNIIDTYYHKAMLIHKSSFYFDLQKIGSSPLIFSHTINLENLS